MEKMAALKRTTVHLLRNKVALKAAVQLPNRSSKNGLCSKPPSAYGAAV